MNGQIVLMSALGEQEHAKEAAQILLQNMVEMIVQGKQMKLKTATCNLAQVSVKDLIKLTKTEGTAIDIKHIEHVQ